MENTKVPEGFKFEENRLRIVIDAQGKEDGHTISNKIEADIRCEYDFALQVLDNAFEKDPQMFELFRKAVALRSLDSLLGDKLKDMLTDLESEVEEPKEN